MKFKIGTGADASVISEKTFSVMENKPKLKNVDTTLDSPRGRLSCLGHFIANTMRKQKQLRSKVHVIRVDDSHLGRNVAVEMGLVKHIAELKEKNTPYPSSDVRLLKVKC